MFAVHCPVIGSRVLIFRSQLRGLTSHALGIDLTFRCGCGGTGVWRTGIRAAGDRLVAHEAPQVPQSSPVGALPVS
jgi:hypothetical protein